MYREKKINQNLSDYNQFVFEKIFEVNKNQIFSSKKMRNSGNCIYDHAHSIVLRRGFLIQYAGQKPHGQKPQGIYFFYSPFNTLFLGKKISVSESCTPFYLTVALFLCS